MPLSATGAAEAPFILRQPMAQSCPLVFASPHSGHLYPPAFIAAARLDPLALRRSEDSFVDELFAAAPAHGAPLLAATFPRAYCDANRDAWELDPGLFSEPLPPWVNTASPRAAAGLGTVPGVVAFGDPIYREKLAFKDAQARIERCWKPFHAALTALVAETRRRFGECLLIDCHSMPSPARSSENVDVVLGDAHGKSCAEALVVMLESTLRRLGYRVRRNDPYSGGYITHHYGVPREGVHAIQIEIARGLYMDERRISRLANFTRLQHDLEQVIRALANNWEAALK